MPVHIIPSGAEDDDTAVLEAAIAAFEGKGEEIVQVDNQTGFPNGRWVIFTRRPGRRGSTEQRG